MARLTNILAMIQSFQPPSAARGRKKMTLRHQILIADDSMIVRQILGSYVRANGHALLEARDGTEAVELARDVDLDLIIMDSHMPNMTGAEATFAIRRLGSKRANVPIIACTSDFGEHELLTLHMSGINTILRKPVNQREFLLAISEALDN